MEILLVGSVGEEGLSISEEKCKCDFFLLNNKSCYV